MVMLYYVFRLKAIRLIKVENMCCRRGGGGGKGGGRGFPVRKHQQEIFGFFKVENIGLTLATA